MRNLLKYVLFETRVELSVRRTHRQNAQHYFTAALKALDEGKLHSGHVENLFASIAAASNRDRSIDIVDHALAGGGMAAGLPQDGLEFLVSHLPKESSAEWPSKVLYRPTPELSPRALRARAKTLGR